jgi:hypothetical protein
VEVEVEDEDEEEEGLEEAITAEATALLSLLAIAIAIETSGAVSVVCGGSRRCTHTTHCLGSGSRAHYCDQHYSDYSAQHDARRRTTRTTT